MAIIDSIKDKLDNIIYPKTVTKAVYDDETQERLDHKLDEMVQQSNDVVVEHESKTLSQGLVVERDGSVLGTQTITGLKGKPKQIIAFMNNKASNGQFSIGIWSEVGGSYALYNILSENIVAGNNTIVTSATNRTQRTHGRIQNVKNGSFEIEWIKSTEDSGTQMQIFFFCLYHGGA